MAGDFLCAIYELDLADIESIRALRALSDLKRDFVSFLKLVKRNVLELVGMEEKIFVAVFGAVDFDEAEAFVVLLDDYSFLHTRDR